VRNESSESQCEAVLTAATGTSRVRAAGEVECRHGHKEHRRSRADITSPPPSSAPPSQHSISTSNLDPATCVIVVFWILKLKVFLYTGILSRARATSNIHISARAGQA
jgi:hypothetical protein